MASSGISVNEILEALAAASECNAPEGAKTIVELTEESKLCRRTVTSALRALHREGRLAAHQVMRVAMDGKNRPVPAYTILPKK